jgi:hypothetical protein
MRLSSWLRTKLRIYRNKARINGLGVVLDIPSCIVPAVVDDSIVLIPPLQGSLLLGANGGTFLEGGLIVCRIHIEGIPALASTPLVLVEFTSSAVDGDVEKLRVLWDGHRALAGKPQRAVPDFDSRDRQTAGSYELSGIVVE